MDNIIWTRRSALELNITNNYASVSFENSAVKLREISGFSLIQVIARRGKWPEVCARAATVFGATPLENRVVSSGLVSLIWSGPHQFFVRSPLKSGKYPMRSVSSDFAGLASLSEQTDGRSLVEMSGDRTREILGKVSSLDFHETAFPVGTSVVTAIDHVPIHMLRTVNGFDGSPSFNMFVFRSYVSSIWGTLCEAADSCAT